MIQFHRMTKDEAMKAWKENILHQPKHGLPHGPLSNPLEKEPEGVVIVPEIKPVEVPVPRVTPKELHVKPAFEATKRKPKQIKNVWLKTMAEKAGGVTNLSKMIGVPQPNISAMIYGDKGMGPALKARIEKAIQDKLNE